MIYVKAAREDYNEVIIDNIILILINLSLADAMKKYSVLPALVEALHKNQIHHQVEKSVERTTRSPTNETEKA